MGLHVIQVEVGRTLDDRIPFPEEILVAGEQVMLPQVGGEPGAAVGEHPPLRTVHRACDAPQVCIVMRHPAAGAVHGAGRDGTRLAQFTDELEQGLGGLRKACHLGRPVVHLRVDVDGVFAVPGSVRLVVPDALEIRGLAAGLGTADQEITPVVEQQGHHPHVVAAIEGIQAPVGGQFRIFPGRKIQPDPVVLGGIQGRMPLLQMTENLLFSRSHRLVYLCLWIPGDIVIIHIIGGAGDVDGGIRGAADIESVLGGTHLPVCDYVGPEVGIDFSLNSLVVHRGNPSTDGNA